ncbi:MAG: cyclic nucleotide-binding domain-containing protein [Deltaproteobacteria bacterium]|nr:cyclic nucleotide-binding domain-containing protein [Deltaproteobacteria bacterium]
MISIEDLKKVVILQRLTNRMLETLTPHVQLRQFEEKDVIFEEGEKADDFYMVKRGKVLLEVELAKDVIIALGTVKTGFSFGWSALLDVESSYASYAVCVEPCEIFSIPGDKFREILDQDHDMGYLVNQGVINAMKSRLERRTGQFLKVMSKHPDIKKVLEA